MTNEIKEILDIYVLGDRELTIDYIDKSGIKKEYEYISNEALLDYITNLQEKNKKLKTIKWQIKNLKQEWLDIVENETLVFDNDNLLNFMNKLERILRGDE